jgi:MprA protease rhombosortase-interaction domain-containing protein
LNGGNRRVIWQYQDNEQKASDIILGHCREGQAAMVFMFMAAVLLLASGLMGFLKRRKGF